METGISPVPEGYMEVTVKVVWSIGALVSFSISLEQPGFSLSVLQPFSVQLLCSLFLRAYSACSPFYSPILPGSLCPGLPHPGFVDFLFHHPLAQWLSSQCLCSNPRTNLTFITPQTIDHYGLAFLRPMPTLSQSPEAMGVLGGV